MFLMAEPHITGVILSAMVARRMAPRMSSTEIGCSLMKLLGQLVVDVGDVGDDLLARALGDVGELRGHVLDADVVAVRAVEVIRFPTMIGSMMPRKSDSAPIGTWIFTGWWPSFSLSMSETRS